MKVFHVELSDETAHWLARRIESGEYRMKSSQCGKKVNA